MKTFTTILIFFLLLFSNESYSQNYIKYYSNGNVKEKGTFIDSIYIGVVTRYYIDGKISFIGHYNKLGQEEGVIQHFYPNGQKEFEYISIDGNPIGEAYYYYQTGELKKITNFGDISESKPSHILELNNLE